MIQLKSLIFENKKSIPHILFVTDRALDRRRGFARKLISNRQCTGEIRTQDKGSSADLRDTVNLYANPYYDLVVVMSRGIYEVSEKTDTDIIKANYDIIISYCHSINVPVCMTTFPSLQFVDDKFKDKINFTLSDDRKLDRWIQDNADYILDTGIFDDDVYFEENGVFLNREAHNVLYQEMLTIINRLDFKNDEEIPKQKIIPDRSILKIGSQGDKVDELQTMLIALGYKIKFSELMTNKFNISTENAVNAFKEKNNLKTDGIVDDKLIKLIQDAINKHETPNEDDTFDTEKERPIYQKDMPKNVNEFIEKYKDIAIEEREKNGIPASITLAQAGLESGWGTSYLAQVGRNFFGVRCGSWTGDKIYVKDELGPKSCYRAYDSPEASFSDHSRVLMQPRYSKAFTFPVTDYENWAKEIDAGGYAVKGRYAPAVIKIIKTYGLDKYDKTSAPAVSSDSEKKSSNGIVGSILGVAGAATVGAGALFGLSTGPVNSKKAMIGGINGDWDGSMSRTLQIAKLANDFVGRNIITSQKRTKVKTASGNTSDHYVGQTDAYAVDLATRGAAGDELFYHIMNFLGKPNLKPGKWHNINKDGYRYQIGWQVPDHYNHIHVGVKKL